MTNADLGELDLRRNNFVVVQGGKSQPGGQAIPGQSKEDMAATLPE